MDKTELIAYTNSVLGTESMLTCSSRPRRFGKSFAAKMLAAYYSKGADARSLFDNLKFDSYWTKTETYESLRDYIDLDYPGLKGSIIDMLGGNHCRIDTGTFQNDLTSISTRNDIFTLFVHLGYLAYDIATSFFSQETHLPSLHCL